MMTEQEIKWLPDAEDHDYPAAASYLGLVYDDAKVRDLLAGLKAAGIARFKANGANATREFDFSPAANARPAPPIRPNWFTPCPRARRRNSAAWRSRRTRRCPAKRAATMFNS